MDLTGPFVRSVHERPRLRYVPGGEAKLAQLVAGTRCFEVAYKQQQTRGWVRWIATIADVGELESEFASIDYELTRAHAHEVIARACSGLSSRLAELLEDHPPWMGPITSELTTVGVTIVDEVRLRPPAHAPAARARRAAERARQAEKRARELGKQAAALLADQGHSVGSIALLIGAWTNDVESWLRERSEEQRKARARARKRSNARK